MRLEEARERKARDMGLKLRQLAHAKRCEASHKVTCGAQLKQQARNRLAVTRALNAADNTRRVARNRMHLALEKGLKTRRTRGKESELHARFMRRRMRIR